MPRPPSPARRRRTLRARLEEDDGVGLVEILVAVFVLTIALSAMASTAITSLAATVASERRTVANQLGNESIENLRGLPWERLGFYAADAPPSGSVVLSGTASSACPPAPAMGARACPGVRETVRAGVTYSVETSITWADSPIDGSGAADADANTNDVKALDVTVGWQHRGQSEQVALSSSRSPRGDEEAPSAPSQIATFSVSPSVVLLDDLPGEPTQPLVLELRLKAGAFPTTLPTVTFPNTTGSQTVTLSLDAASGTYRKELTPSAVGTQRPGVVVFKATVTTATGTSRADREVLFDAPLKIWSDPEPGTTKVQVRSAASPYPLRPLCVGNDPGPGGGKGNKDKLLQARLLVVEVTGMLPGEAPVISWTNPSSGQKPMLRAGTTGPRGGEQFYYYLPTDTLFTSTSTSVTVTATRSSDGVIDTWTQGPEQDPPASPLPVARVAQASSCPTS